MSSGRDDWMDNYDTESEPTEVYKKFGIGEFAVRATAFERTETRKDHHPVLAFRLTCEGSLTDGIDDETCVGARITHRVTLSEGARPYVRAFVMAATRGERWTGSLRSDSDVRKLALGKVFIIRTKERKEKGDDGKWKTYTDVEEIMAATNDLLSDLPDESWERYAEEKVFREREQRSGGGSRGGYGGSRGGSGGSRSGGGSRGGSSDRGQQFDDDDIPF